jgi:hypothetical protein
MSGLKSNIRILDKSTYNRKTLETFEMVAAYYVDLFYNHLYFEAKKLRNDKVVSSVTEGYKHALSSFLQGIEDPKLYKKSLLAMHTFFVENGFASLTFTQCTERVTIEFIPEDYYDSVLNSKKNSILRIVLNGVNKNFILKLVNNYLGMIIDHHNEPDNTRILQDEFIDLLLIEKESMYKRFVVGKTASGGFSKKNEIMESMQKEIKRLFAEKYESRKLASKLKKIIIAKEEQIQKELEKINQLNDIIAELKNELRCVNVGVISNTVPHADADTPMTSAFMENKLNSVDKPYETISEEGEAPADFNAETEDLLSPTNISRVRTDNILHVAEKNNNTTKNTADDESLHASNSQIDGESMFTFDNIDNMWD